ncbi:hypothetical protein [Nocardia seriolae]|uniref:Uncharacterized protein n=1 Tax=Nocardia seriolae TaxID=37332 RepID=A0A0B8N1J5_9NOCA|nr:hypothetical protein [Nocardia seriolae]APA97418.1 hypothetical protein NS506_03366 [Nocardia seriolae]MTJ62326.1 hypothetical protein [Nocardia seriolae]MTJ70751.1 hypothetical protein [Nocardia seriolae]MTJ87232.1 hypothetical protein [Nocardia seriolae]MTK31226.1 hypothetical protein [Nocardia seriolae]
MTTLTTTPAVTANVAAPVAVPSVHRRAVITWLAVYPTITLALALLGPLMTGLPLMARTLVLTAVVVPATAYLLVPMLMKANHHLTLRLHR